MEQFHGTTIVSVRRKTPQGDQVAIGGDGQVTLGNIVIKGTARKVRRLHHGKVLAGFAGATADAFTLFERFEAKLEKHQGQLARAAVELTKDWRTDRVLRRLEAMLAVADATTSLIITGNGDVLEPEDGIVAIGGDGQVTLGNIVIKGSARKVRKLHHDRVLAGFAGATADAFTLFERFEGKLEKYQGHLVRAAIELTKDWRTDRVLRRLEAMLAVADAEASLIITGNGDVLEPERGIVAIGSGGAYAQSAAIAMLENSDLSARDIVKKSLEIAGEVCIYTNMNHTIETL